MVNGTAGISGNSCDNAVFRRDVDSGRRNGHSQNIFNMWVIISIIKQRIITGGQNMGI